MELIPTHNDYQKLVGKITKTYQYGQQRATIAVNNYLVETYWKIGQHIVEFEQGGKAQAQYGKMLLPTLSKDLPCIWKGF